jgi:hypothetical protein
MSPNKKRSRNLALGRAHVVISKGNHFVPRGPQWDRPDEEEELATRRTQSLIAVGGLLSVNYYPTENDRNALRYFQVAMLRMVLKETGLLEGSVNDMIDAYTEYPDRGPILADALEEAGYANVEVLKSLRAM